MLLDQIDALNRQIDKLSGQSEVAPLGAVVLHSGAKWLVILNKLSARIDALLADMPVPRGPGGTATAGDDGAVGDPQRRRRQPLPDWIVLADSFTAGHMVSWARLGWT